MSAESRLRWRCRRGTRELDRLLGDWLDNAWPDADVQRRADFDRLLDVQDPDLWDWLMGHADPADPGFAAIVDDIRARHRI
ncbi:succinate dehydrogenase assembly factor 2 [Dokdonella sp.]|uniref:FAD assembly factor SdhE n=1 Tax=Dokdonella sp. TaxID=2291710 RepID=UPI0026139B96|nr:succinate dehydrogenase assembly factor 2 [Dokdonella sp.]